MIQRCLFIVFGLIVGSTPSIAGDWRVVEERDNFTLLIQYDGILHVYVPTAKNSILFLNWARIYKSPVQIWPDQPMVKHHKFFVGLGCDPKHRSTTVYREEYTTSAFDLIRGVSHENGALKLIADVPGLDAIQKYACDRPSIWKPMDEDSKIK